MQRTSKHTPVLILIFALTIIGPHALSANDSAASSSAGGIKLTREARISMQKERLTIGARGVRVEYEFLNETDSPITTEVAFPVPEYGVAFDDPLGPRDFGDFRLWVNGKVLPYKIDAKAIHKGKDYSALLRRYHVDIASFGHLSARGISRDIARLSRSQRFELLRVGLIDSDADGTPQWTVQKIYHWTQTFPARKLLRVAHEYSPYVGFVNLGEKDFESDQASAPQTKPVRHRDPDEPGYYPQPETLMSDFCIEPALAKKIRAEYRSRKGRDLELDPGVSMHWVEYILTTANSWKTPIKDFELVVEQPAPRQRRASHVSFCWEGRIEHPAPDRFVAHASDFVPKQELLIGFIRP